MHEVHNTHHPISSALYYEDQKPEAKRYSEIFIEKRLPKFLGWFETILARNPKGPNFLVGARLSYADLSLFQVVEGLRYAFPKAMASAEQDVSHVVALHDRVAARPRIRAYLASPRRIPFNQHGLFRHVIGKDHMGPVADEQVLSHGASAGDDPVQLLEKRLGVDDHAVGDDRELFGMQDARGQQRELVGLAVEDDRMPRVVTAKVPHDDVVVLGEQIDDFPLGLISPLQPDHGCCRHVACPCSLKMVFS